MTFAAMIPVIVFYLASQKHIIRGIVAGAVKGARRRIKHGHRGQRRIGRWFVHS